MFRFNIIGIYKLRNAIMKLPAPQACRIPLNSITAPETLPCPDYRIESHRVKNPGTNLFNKGLSFLDLIWNRLMNLAN